MTISIKNHTHKFSELDIQVDDIATPTLQMKFIRPYKEIIQKKVTEEIGRDVLNNSKFLMRDYKPFVAPESESDGECDNLGKNIKIDTKLLMLESSCYLISKDESIVRSDNRKHEFFMNCSFAYYKLTQKLPAMNECMNRQFEIINKIEKTLIKFKNKNILFISPMPEMDVIFMQQVDFSESYIGDFFYVLSCIKKKLNFKKHLYFAYPLFNNQYNLVRIFETKFICESFIKCDSQTKYIETIQFGMTMEKNGDFIPYEIEINMSTYEITNYKYRIKNILLRDYSDLEKYPD